MSRAKRIVSWTLAALLLVGAATWVTAAIRHHVRYGSVFDEKALRPEVKRGDRFTLAVPDRGASVGDEWSATPEPDGLLTPVANRMEVSDPLDRVFGSEPGGGAGTRYFVYTAGRRGTVTVQLYNCFQGLCRSGRTDPWSRGVTWTVTIT